VRSLVQQEALIVGSKKDLEAAEKAVSGQPETLPHRIIAHFQHLFDTPSLDGVFPKMNALYLFTEEMTNKLGSFPDYCMHNAPCDVLVVKPNPKYYHQ